MTQNFRLRQIACVLIAIAILSSCRSSTGNVSNTPPGPESTAPLAVSTAPPAQTNLSREEAVGIARRLLGADTLDVIPYQNRNSEHQFIAVLAKDGDEVSVPDSAKVVVLEGVGDVFTIHETGVSTVEKQEDLAAPGKAGDHITQPHWGIVDVDKDGIFEIYGVYLSYGTGGGAYSIDLWDPDSNKRDLALMTFAMGRAPGPAEIEIASTKPRALVTDWLLTQAALLSDQVGLVDRSDEVTDWEQRNGAGFQDGPVNLKRIPGPVPKRYRESVECQVADSPYTWYSIFKGPIYGVDSRSDDHFVVFVPADIYAWSPSLVAGARYLWLAVSVAKDPSRPQTRSLIVFDKASNRLDMVEIPELGALICKSSRLPCDPGVDRLNLGYARTMARLTVDGQPITLPPQIDPGELKSARSCQ